MRKLSQLLSNSRLHRFFLALGLLIAVGCGQQPAKLTLEQSKAFDNAPAEVKQAWDKAQTADKANNYEAAVTLYDSLTHMYLNEQQHQTLEAARIAFGERLTKAVAKNDPAAVKAIQLSQKNRSR